jgi:predicted ATPase/DNA-binding SARP family transcriptional activator
MDAMTRGLRVHLFGVPSVDWNGSAVAISVRPLCAVLLAMLVLSEPDRRLSRKAVAADLWPDDDESVAAGNLRRHLSFLCSALPAPDECIGRDREALWCPSRMSLWCDVVEFEHGNVDAYDADFMEGYTHEWVLAQRERLRLGAVTALKQRAEFLRDEDDYAGAIACARRAIAIDPIDESIAQLEIELHGERGDKTAMDIAYTSLCRRLSEIDAEPAAATAALVDRFHTLARDAAARLPRPMTTFVGSALLDESAALVPAHRLVTIVGPGGVGKTRLAIEIAHRLAPTFADGAYFADLSTIADGDALPAALSRALGVPTDLASKGFTGVQTFLRNRRALLVLDNCEQIAEACSWFLNDVFGLAPHVHVVATTREAFGLRAERCYPLAPLDPQEAAALFADRARSAAWDVDDVSDGPARIAKVVKRLDGLPLAVELAASMLGTLSLADLERQLDESTYGLRSRDPTAPARHRSLLDVIAWSVSLLDDRERDAFVRLAVFAGSFSAEAADAVCSVGLETLAELVAKSVLVREDAIESRFVFLISVGEYGRWLFDADPQARVIRDAHAARYAAIAMRSKETAFWSTERRWLDEIDHDFANSTQAFRWSIASERAVRSGLHLAIGLANYFIRRGFLSEGLSWLRTALERAEPLSREGAELLAELALFETRRGRFEIALQHARAACADFARLGLDGELARATNIEAALMLHLGRVAEAKVLLERALPLAQRAGDLRCEALVLSNFAFLLSSSAQAEARDTYVLALHRFNEAGYQSGAARMFNAIAASDFTGGRYEAANENLTRALQIHRDFGDLAATAGILSDLGDVALVRGDIARARECYTEALTLCEACESQLCYESVFSGFAALAAESLRYRDAARLLGAARPYGGGTTTPANRRVFERARRAAGESLGEDECEFEVRFGRDLSRKEATRIARSVLEPIFESSLNEPSHTWLR